MFNIDIKLDKKNNQYAIDHPDIDLELKKYIEEEIDKIKLDYPISIANILGCCYAFDKLTLNNATNEDLEKGMIIGANLVYQLREFLLKDEIYYDIGVEYKEDGKDKLAYREISQSIMLQQLRPIIKEQEMQISSSLSSYNSRKFGKQYLKSLGDDNLVAKWNLIKEQALKKYSKEDKTAYAYLSTKKHWHDLYHLSNKDYGVFGYYSGAGQDKLYYFWTKESDGSSDPTTQSEKLKFYNKGNLYEQFKTKLASLKRSADISEKDFMLDQLDTNDKFPLTGLFYNIDRENIQGLQGGDYLKTKQKKQYQAKLGNEGIISFTNIKEAVNKIKLMFLNYTDVQALKKEIKDLYTSKQIDKNYNKAISNSINNLLELNK